MTRGRAVFIALVGAIACAACLVLLYGRAPASLMTEAGLASPSSGFYPPEQGNGIVFRWVGTHAELRLPWLDRRVGWRWTARTHAWRPDAATPTLRVAVDRGAAREHVITRDGQSIEVALPPRPGTRGVTVTFDVTPAFVPGGADQRALGLALEGMALVPIDGRPRPPMSALLLSAGAVLAFGLALAALDVAWTWQLVVTLGVAAATAGALVAGRAVDGAYPRQAAILIGSVGLGTWLVAALVDRVGRSTLSAPARAVVALSAVACALKLLVLLHPSMPQGDGIFHAHRFEAVLSGRFYFTSIAPGNYEFPYPILLYLVAAPFSALAETTADRMQLLRTVVTVADAVAGACLYWMIVRATRHRRAGLLAVAWYHLIPMTGWIMTWGNLTNAFGQVLFVIAMAAVAGLPIDRSFRRWGVVAGLAFGSMVSHPSACAILAIVLVVTAGLYWWRGGDLRPAAVGTALAVAVAAAAAVAIYYGWFVPLYVAQFTRIAGESGAGLASASPEWTMGARLEALPSMMEAYLGWPALVFGGVGAWRLHRDADSARLTWLVAGWGGACLAFLVLAVVTPVEMRTHYALFPALATVAAFGTAWAWRQGAVMRVAAGAVMAAAVWVGVHRWTGLVVG